MKILHVIPSLAAGFGGPSIAGLELCKQLIRKGEDVTIFTTNADVRGKLDVKLNNLQDIEGVKVYYFAVDFLNHYKISFSLLEELKKRIPNFDIVHIHSLFQFPSLAASYYCRKYRKPYIIRPLGQLDPFLLKRHRLRKWLYMNLFEISNLRFANSIHYTSEFEREQAKKVGLELNSFVIPLGVDLNAFLRLPERGSFRQKFPQLKDKKVILFLSRINFKKGLDLLVKAFKALVKQRSDIFLVIAGPDYEGYAERIKTWLSKEGLLDKAIFTGMLSGEEKLAAFIDSDLFVLPSYSENFGIVVLEAIACGVPVIISNKVGIYKEVQAAQAGIVVENDPDSLFYAIEQLLNDDLARKQVIENGKKLLSNYYDTEKIADALIKVYNRILNISG